MPQTFRLPATITPSDFAARLKILKDLHQDAKDAYKVAAGAILTFAVEYASLYRDVARNGDLVKRLNDDLDLTYDASNRLRGIASQAKQLKLIQRYLPPSPESIYEISRGLKKNGKLIMKAIEAEQLTPQSTLRDIRGIRKNGSPSATNRPRQLGPAKSSTLPKVSVQHLKSIQITVKVLLRHVPSWHDVTELKDIIVKRLAEHHAHYVAMGHGDQSPLDDTQLKAYLDTYARLTQQIKSVKAAKQSAEHASRLKELQSQWSAVFESE